MTDAIDPDGNGEAMSLECLVHGMRARHHQVDLPYAAARGGMGEGAENLASVAMPGDKEVRLGLPREEKVSRRGSQPIRMEGVFSPCGGRPGRNRWRRSNGVLPDLERW